MFDELNVVKMLLKKKTFDSKAAREDHFLWKACNATCALICLT